MVIPVIHGQPQVPGLMGPLQLMLFQDMTMGSSQQTSGRTEGDSNREENKDVQPNIQPSERTPTPRRTLTSKQRNMYKAIFRLMYKFLHKQRCQIEATIKDAKYTQPKIEHLCTLIDRLSAIKLTQDHAQELEATIQTFLQELCPGTYLLRDSLSDWLKQPRPSATHRDSSNSRAQFQEWHDQASRLIACHP
jgi:hypothetical protein